MNQEELRELYRIAIEEYRFQVNLNWDRTKFYLGLNLTVIAGAAGLVNPAKTWQGQIISSAIFFVGFFIALAGGKALTQGHKYYRKIVVTKTLLEAELKLLQSGMTASSTSGQQEAGQIL